MQKSESQSVGIGERSVMILTSDSWLLSCYS